MYVSKTFDSFCPEVVGYWEKISSVRNSTIFQTLEWNLAWSKSLKKFDFNSSIVIVTVMNDQEICALAPLQIRKKNGVRWLEFLASEINDYNNILFDDNLINDLSGINEILTLILASVRDYDVCNLRQVPSKIGIHCNTLANSDRFKSSIKGLRINKRIIEPTNKTLVPKKISKQNSRNIKKLKAISEADLYIEIDRSLKTPIINHVIKEKEKQYRKTGAVNIFSDPSIKHFFANLDQIDTKKSQVNVSTSALAMGKKLIAAHMGMSFGGVFYYYMPVADTENFGRFSPGSILLEELGSQSLSASCHIFDFTVGQEEYKKRWCNDGVSLSESLYANTVVGIFTVLLHKFKQKLKRNLFLRKHLMKLRAKSFQ